VFRSDDAMKTETIKHGKQSNRIYSFTADGVKEIKAKVSVKKQKKDDNTDESIRMEGLRKDVEKQGIDVSTIKAGIDALVQKNGENTDRVRDLTRDLEKSEQALADTEKKLRDREWELSQYQRENQQLKQQIYNLQHPQQSWDEPER
jgi:chromosome segregation ATPase